jgi:hypothetical protein
MYQKHSNSGQLCILSGHHVSMPYKPVYVMEVSGDVRPLNAVPARVYELLCLDTLLSLQILSAYPLRRREIYLKSIYVLN